MGILSRTWGWSSATSHPYPYREGFGGIPMSPAQALGVGRDLRHGLSLSPTRKVLTVPGATHLLNSSIFRPYLALGDTRGYLTVCLGVELRHWSSVSTTRRGLAPSYHPLAFGVVWPRAWGDSNNTGCRSSRREGFRSDPTLGMGRKPRRGPSPYCIGTKLGISIVSHGERIAQSPARRDWRVPIVWHGDRAPLHHIPIPQLEGLPATRCWAWGGSTATSCPYPLLRGL